MIIKKIAVGNGDEAFVEDRLSTGVNIISSDDNNKGKTIIIQSALYALGNEPIFPAGFDYKNYYHGVELILDDMSSLMCCRKESSFIVKHNNDLFLLNSVSELKRTLNKICFYFPYILKDNSRKMVDPVLLYQMFFVGQDRKDPSNICKPGYYNKKDFIEMIFSLKGIEPNCDDSIESLKSKLLSLNERKKVIEKENEIFKSNNASAAFVSSSIDLNVVKKMKQKIEIIRMEMSSLLKERNRFITKENYNQLVLEQLESLNTRIKAPGKLKCKNCGSTNIEFVTENSDFKFDISDNIMRNNIVQSIKEKIGSYEEEIERLTKEITLKQEELSEILKSSSESKIDEIIYYGYSIIDRKEIDNELASIKKEIEKIDTLIKKKEIKEENNANQKENIMLELTKEMNRVSRLIDENSKLELTLFSKKDETFSGCEETEYFLSRLYALKTCLNHSYPIIMDHFRAGELSSKKEKKVIELFNQLGNQVIFTVTLKDEEMGKYSAMNEINHIDYSINTEYKILSKDYVKEMELFMKELNANLSD